MLDQIGANPDLINDEQHLLVVFKYLQELLYERNSLEGLQWCYRINHKMGKLTVIVNWTDISDAFMGVLQGPSLDLVDC